MAINPLDLVTSPDQAPALADAEHHLSRGILRIEDRGKSRRGIRSVLGAHHPFDDKPLKLVDLCPDLSTAVAAVGPKR